MAFCGVNVGGRRLSSTGTIDAFGAVGEADIVRLASWRFTHVRFVLEEPVLDSAAGWAALDDALAACRRNKLAAVVCLLAEQGDLFVSFERRQALALRWEQLAARYRDWPLALYCDLLERPAPPDDLTPDHLAELGAPRLSPAAAHRPRAPGWTAGRAWSALAGQLARAICAVHPQATIVVQAIDGQPGGFAHLRPVRDPHLPRVVYAFQYFAPTSFTQQADARVDYPGVIGGVQWDRARLAQELAPALAFRDTYQAPLYLAAFGTSNRAPLTAQRTWVRAVLGLCHAERLGWAYWDFKSERFGLICAGAECAGLQYQNPLRLDYDLLGVLQSEA